MFDNWMLWNGISFNPSQKSLEYIQKIRQRNSSLPADERRFLMITLKTPYFKELRTVLSGDDPTKVRDFFEKDMFRIFGPGILERHREAFLWAVEHIVQWPYQLGIGRRPARSRYLPGHIRHILWMAHTFYTQAVVDADICDILSGDLPEDALSFVRDSRTGFCSEIVAYEIDRGNVRLKTQLMDMLRGEEGAPDPSRTLFKGIFMSHDAELHRALGRLLVAARLEEGLRQAICETADEGTLEGFLEILDVIAENDLIRFSSVKRAAAVWLGFSVEDGKDLERLSRKEMTGLRTALMDAGKRRAMLESEDNLSVYLALCAVGIVEIGDAVRMALDLTASGTRRQALVCALFSRSLGIKELYRKQTVGALLSRSDDQELTAVYLSGQQYYWRTAIEPYEPKSPDHFFDGQLDAEPETESAEIKPVPPFEDADVTRRFFDVMRTCLKRLSKKETVYDPCVMPWFAAKLARSDIALCLCATALALDDRAKDEAIALIPLLQAGDRSACVRALLSTPKRAAQRQALMVLVADRESMTQRDAFRILDELPAAQLDYSALEGHLRLKDPIVRKNVMTLLMKQGDDGLMSCVKRLLADRRETCRAAGYELMTVIARSQERKALHGSCRAALTAQAHDEPREKMLWETCAEALGLDAARADAEKPHDPPGKRITEEDLYTDRDEDQPDLSFVSRNPVYAQAFFDIFPDSGLRDAAGSTAQSRAAGATCASLRQAWEDISALEALIQQHGEDPVISKYKGGGLLDYAALPTLRQCEINGETYPLAEVWENWWQTLNDTGRLVRALLSVSARLPGEQDTSGTVEMLFGAGFSRQIDLIQRVNLERVCGYLIGRHADRTLLTQAALYLTDILANRLSDREFYPKSSDRYSVSIIADRRAGWLLMWLTDPPEVEVSHCFDARRILPRRYYAILARRDTAEGEKTAYAMPYLQYTDNPDVIRVWDYMGNRVVLDTGVCGYLKAYRRGQMSKASIYRFIFHPKNLRNALMELSLLAQYRRTIEPEKRLTVWRSNHMFGPRNRRADVVRDLLGKKELVNGEDRALLDLAQEVYGTVLSIVLDDELKRGEMKGRYTDFISGIAYFSGVKWLGEIWTAMGEGKLHRSAWYYDSSVRSQSLSHLLGVCAPAPEDDASALRAVAGEKKISDSRLIETAMYNPAWIDLVGEALGIDGFRSAAYYFIAHMNEQQDEERQAVIARYTPLTAEQLQAGAFDARWLKDVYAAVGEKRFNQLYAAAKYITDGARHSRARRYADAALGRLNVDDAEAQISEKRNKDLLMAYAAIPLADEADLLRRYLFIQAFLKQSRQFGAVRSASEKQASEMALVNLAANAGYEDVTRLTLSLETRAAAEYVHLFDPRDVEGMTLHLEADEAGRIGIVCEKDGKRLKSLPPSLKKHEYVARLAEGKKALSGQQSRAKRFFEEAMEDGAVLSAGEIAALWDNPAVRPLIERLVFRAEERFLMPVDGGFADLSGGISALEANESLTVAHPLDFYRAGVWLQWQSYIFERRIIQPFKQVFRELYIKTADELGQSESQRYAGYQIQPKKAAAVLRTRRWLAAEGGLEKVFYKEDLMVVISAAADWFSPADIEPPTLDGVIFLSRSEWKRVPIDSVPDRLFSEIMRDVDLAVSVAYAGGVDPQASHSTIEMREALLNFTLPLFGLTNVRVEKRHAVIHGKRADYTVHLGSGVIHQRGGAMINIVAVHSQHRGKLFLPFADDDPQTAEILTKVLFLAEDQKIRDPVILSQIRG